MRRHDSAPATSQSIAIWPTPSVAAPVPRIVAIAFGAIGPGPSASAAAPHPKVAPGHAGTPAAGHSAAVVAATALTPTAAAAHARSTEAVAAKGRSMLAAVSEPGAPRTKAAIQVANANAKRWGKVPAR